MIDIFHFKLAVIFSSFNFHMYLESSVLLTYFLWQKSLVWFLKRSLNEVSEIPKYLLSGLLGSDTTALYIQCLPLNIYHEEDISGSVSTIASMVIRSWLKNSLIVGSNDCGHISTSSITELYCIFIKHFHYLTMFQEVAFD